MMRPASAREAWDSENLSAASRGVLFRERRVLLKLIGMYFETRFLKNTEYLHACLQTLRIRFSGDTEYLEIARCYHKLTPRGHEAP